jgi:hypothetical protein
MAPLFFGSLPLSVPLCSNASYNFTLKKSVKLYHIALRHIAEDSNLQFVVLCEVT